MKKQAVTCPYCNSVARLRLARDIHPTQNDSHAKWLYVCANWPECDSYVSAHDHNREPMGTLANGRLRNKRILAHKALEKYRRLTRMEKSAVYSWLMSKLDMAETQIHIAMFSEPMCDHVIALCEEACQAYSDAKKS